MGERVVCLLVVAGLVCVRCGSRLFVSGLPCSSEVLSWYFHILISYLNLLRRVALRQKPFFKGPSDKNLITIYR